MKASLDKTARFAEVVKKSGTPEVAYIWSKPRQDKPFSSALRQDRVMTLKQETLGTKKDFGVVGFLPEKNVSYLIFPRSLKGFKGCRIIGINYDLVRTPGPIGRLVRQQFSTPTHWEKGTRASSTGLGMADPAGALSENRRFEVTVRFSASMDMTELVQAESKKAARQKALNLITQPNLNRGTVTRKIVVVRQVRP